MLFEDYFSVAGKGSADRLTTLRQTLGHGVDPAYDYSQQRTSKRPRDATEVPTNRREESGTDALISALREVDGPDVDVYAETEAMIQVWVAKQEARKVQEVRNERERKRPSSAFLARSRAERSRLSGEDRFRAPPPCTYRPNADIHRPRLDTGFVNLNAPKHGAKRTAAADSPEAPSVPPERVADRVPCFVDISKAQGRGDFFKAAGIVVNENSFEQGADIADLNSSKRARQPCFKFSSTKKQGSKPPATSEPGQFNPNLDSVRPRSGCKSFQFGQQIGRRPMSAPTGIGSRLSSAQAVERPKHIPGFDLSKCVARPPLTAHLNVQQEELWEDSEDGAFADVGHSIVTKAVPRPKSALSFTNSLSRLQHAKGSRSYGQDINLARRLEYAKGPKSTESLIAIGNPALPRPPPVCDFSKVPGREQARLFTNKPPRQRGSIAQRFERASRVGEERCAVHDLSELAAGITDLRATRTYEAWQPIEVAA